LSFRSSRWAASFASDHTCRPLNLSGTAVARRYWPSASSRSDRRGHPRAARTEPDL
jgi:hypothetical protein